MNQFLVNIPNSLEFLSCARSVLKDYVTESNNSKDLSNFILNEATDYEIMNLLINKKFPPVPFCKDHEIQLFRELHNIINLNKDLLLDFLDIYEYKSLSYIGPVSGIGLSSNSYVNEQIIDEFITLETNYILSENTVKIDAKKYDSLKRQVKIHEYTISKIKYEIKKSMASGNKKDANRYRRLLKEAEAELKTYKRQLRNVSAGRAPNDDGAQIAEKSAAGVAGIAVIALITLAIRAAWRKYKEQSTKANTACKDKKGQDKEECINQFKLRGLNAQLTVLKQSLNKCNKSTSPSKCKKQLTNKISGVEKKINKIKGKKK